LVSQKILSIYVDPALSGQAGCSYVVSSGSMSGWLVCVVKREFRSSSSPRIKDRPERVNPAARTAAPVPTTSPSQTLRSAEGWSKPAPRCFRVDPPAPACEAAWTTRMGGD
jgi:hypothetical protein